MAGNSQRGHRALKSQRLLDPELSFQLTSKWPLQFYPCRHLPHISYVPVASCVKATGPVASCVKASLTLRRG